MKSCTAIAEEAGLDEEDTAKIGAALALLETMEAAKATDEYDDKKAAVDAWKEHCGAGAALELCWWLALQRQLYATIARLFAALRWPFASAPVALCSSSQ